MAINSHPCAHQPTAAAAFVAAQLAGHPIGSVEWLRDFREGYARHMPAGVLGGPQYLAFLDDRISETEGTCPRTLTPGSGT